MRGLLAALSAGALVAVTVVAFRSLDRATPEFKPPEPSSGKWASEQEFGPADDVSDPTFAAIGSTAVTASP
jgi:hypothetical protein